MYFGYILFAVCLVIYFKLHTEKHGTLYTIFKYFSELKMFYQYFKNAYKYLKILNLKIGFNRAI